MTCPTCQAEIEPGKPCAICADIQRLRQKAIEAGRVRKNFKYEKTKATTAETPIEGQWWQAYD